MSQTRKAAWSHTMGSTPATNEKAIASGTSARATVRPERTSVFNCFGSFNSFFKSIIQKNCKIAGSINISLLYIKKSQKRLVTGRMIKKKGEM
jgi:hypothetical protein